MHHGSVGRRLRRRTLWCRAFLAVGFVAATLIPVPANAAPAGHAYLPPGLARAASLGGGRIFPVIVQGRKGFPSAAVAATVDNELPGATKRRFTAISAVAARLTGGQLLRVADRPGILAITPDLPVRAGSVVGPLSLTSPVVLGLGAEGETLAVTAGTWSGLEPLALSYAWQTCDAAGTCADVPGAGGTTFLVPADTGGTSIRVVETATDATGASASAASEPLAIPAAPPPVDSADPLPAPVVAPPVSVGATTLAGVAEQGSVLTAVDGGWTGNTPISLAYQWQRCDTGGNSCVDVAGGTADGYEPTAADVGSTLRVVVTATNSDGSQAAASDVSARVTPVKHGGRWSWQLWPYAARLATLWDSTTPAATIAVVDSGVDPSVSDLQGKVVRQVVLTSLPDNSPGDGRGHGTFVAALAAGSADGRAGAAPTANIVSLDVLDDHGVGQTSDVLAAMDWISANGPAEGIRVANLSLAASAVTSFAFDPLDRAVERLWLGGIVVVAAAGNFGVDGQPGGVPFSPANDPLAITVGADDLNETETTADDFTAPWSSYGHTFDGFAKPELGAPGRSIVGPVPPGATLASERPDRVVEPGLMRLSGTSLAAPIVAGAAANLLAAHPDWTPDQVKGALMQTAVPLPLAAPQSSGVGEIDAVAAAGATDAPNPNEPLEQFLVPDPEGGPIPVIDTSAWATAAAADPVWATTYWGSTYWGSTYWGSTYWGSTYWGSTTEGATYWGSTYWGSTYWGSTYWGSSGDIPVE